MARKSLLKRAVSSFTALAIATVAMPVIPAFAEAGTVSYSFDGYDVEYSVKNEWTDGQSIEIKITNTGDEPILNWAFKYNAEGVIDGLWNASVYDTKETSYVIKNVGWNYEIAPDASVSFGYTLSDYSGTNPNNFELCAKRVDKTEGYDVQYNITNEWETGMQGEIVITNTSEETLEAWELSFDSTFAINNLWNGKIISSEDNHYVVASEMWSNPIDVGGSKTIGFTGKKQDANDVALSNFSLSVVIIDEDGNSGDTGGNAGNDDPNPNPDIDVTTDTDSDQIPDAYEEIFGTDKNDPDTDDDGLTDYEEIALTGTDPLVYDSVTEGISDADADCDEDGLTNKEELTLGTSPTSADTDFDGLSDYDEINVYNTDPLVADTDGDGLDDGDEITLGTNPLKQDTNDNGIIDSKEKFNQTFTHKVKNEDCTVTEVIVDMECTGNINKTTSVESVMNTDILCTDVVGLVGEPFEIETTSEFDTATLKFVIDKNKLGETEFANLMFLWYNEEENNFVELETTLDKETGTVSITTTHFSKYLIVDKHIWYEAWAIEFNYNPAKEGTNGEPVVRYNTVLAIDCSGSMRSNDPITTISGTEAQYSKNCQRISAATGFITNMNDCDKASIVIFSSKAYIAAEMTNNLGMLKIALQKVTNSGGTSFDAAISKSIDAFSENDIGASYTNNRIILLSDGGSTVSDSVLENAKSKGILIYTIGLGAGSNDRRLDYIAKYTKGQFFKAYTADELIGIYSKVGIDSKFDTTDTDGDGLYDAVESAGIRLQNGTIIYTDPTNPDSDGDGLLDGEEIDPKPLYSTKEDNGWFDFKKYFGINTIQGYYFKMYSSPNRKDTDLDGLGDFLDNEPLNKFIHAFVIYETEIDEEFLHLVNTYDGDDERRPEDFRYSDLTEEELRNIEHIYWGDFLNRNYFGNWKRLTRLLSMGEMQDVAMEMMNHFVDGTGTDFHSNILNRNVAEHQNTKAYTDAVDIVLASILSETNGDLYSLQYNKSTRNDSLMVKKMQGEIDSGNTDLYMPKYDDKFGGLGITIDGLAGNRIEVSSFKLEGNHYSGTLHYVMYDIYGLDSTDITDEYAAFFDLGLLNGFRHWYILQHWDKFDGENRPFITYMEFDRVFEGEIS